VADPFFGGAGPPRKGCIQCGECMTGCRHGAKNTLLTNYLHLAERAGATVHPLTTVTGIRPRDDGRYDVLTERTGAWFRRRRQTFVAGDVVVAAGTLGTQKLLHGQRDAGNLPHLSPRLGELTRTNSEAILGARSFHPPADFTRGVAITSSFHPGTTRSPAPRGGGCSAGTSPPPRATASPTRRGSRRATRRCAASPTRSVASRVAGGTTCSTSR
jgi:cholesterol oxidase